MLSTSVVRSVVIVLVMLVLTSVGGLVSGYSEPDDLGIEGDEIMSSYSRAVQLAFERASDLDSYSNQVLSQTEDWLVVTRVPIDKHEFTVASPDSSEQAPILRGAYIWGFEDSQTSLARLQLSFDMGEIESFSPMVEKQQQPRLVPNDPEFGSQWHLSNTGQTNGVSGEDANVTSVWDSYTGFGVVISVIDDGLDYNHSDINPHYSSELSYDWCDDDSDPMPSSWNGHGTAAAGVAAAAGNNLSLIHI